MRGMQQIKEAWVTYVLTDEDVPNAFTLLTSLRKVVTFRPVAVIVSMKVSCQLKDLLNDAFDFCFLLDERRNVVGLTADEFVKIFTLTLNCFGKCILISPEMLMLRNSDELFEMENQNQNIFCPENNLNVMVLKPRAKLFRNIMLHLANKNEIGLTPSLKKWIKNQTKNAVFLDKIKSGKQLIGNENDFSIVNTSLLQKDEKLQKNVSGCSQTGIVNQAILAYYNSIYANDVIPKLECYANGGSDAPQFSCEMTHGGTEPVAIVGMSCRYPGSANLEEFWNLLIQGEDGTGNPPPFRWLREQCARNKPECRKTNAGFLSVPVDEFDAKFFGISPKEMLFMDPQHRLLHEVVWEGLEDAAIDPLKLRGSNGAVFMGSWINDFQTILEHAGHSEFYRIYMGNSIGAAAARISFLLGLTGPSVATESGCSSAMVAVHMACRSLQNGETNMAIACGVNLLLHPFDKDEMPMVISPDGKCKTFDVDADGFARGEGCGVLVLKKLSDAVKDNDNIWALIRGSGMSQEGVSKSMGTPTVHCEALAMTQALRDANVDPAQVSYVETHGTGTVVGDPMEVSAIAKAYHSKDRVEPLIIGSVKTNVGHTESCSGITGIMKVVLAMKNEVIPPHRNFNTLNPSINLEAIPATIPLEPVPWPCQDDAPRLSGVSSFGITGTDAHVILEEAPKANLNWPLKNLPIKERKLHILKLSAKTDDAMNKLIEKYANHFETSDDALADICYSANTGRSDFPIRATLIGRSNEEMGGLLRSYNVSPKEVAGEVGKICFLFTGQGSQYFGMGQQLYETSAVFRMHFDYCSDILEHKFGINIRDVFWSDKESEASEVSRTVFSQTAIFVVEYALLKVWESLGVKPDCVIGHSLGEFAAAVCAGILCPEDALKMVAERSRLIDNLPRGRMLVIKADKATVQKTLEQFQRAQNIPQMLDFAAVNSAQQTVVAGDTEVILQFSKYCSEKELKWIILEATHAFHSRHMDPMLDAYHETTKSIQFNPTSGATCDYISGMRGNVVASEDVNAIYWVHHTREKVNFLDASKKAVELGCTVFVEVGPQPVLCALTGMNTDANILCVPSLKRNEENWHTFLGTVSKLYTHGVNIEWEGLDQFCFRTKVRVPHYPFIGKKYWPDLMAVTGAAIHPLLGSVVPNASATKLFQTGLNLNSLEYVKDHCIGTNVIFPGTGYLEMCLAAGHATIDGCSETLAPPTRPFKVEDLSIDAPLKLDEGRSVQLQTVVNFNTTSDCDWNDLKIQIFQKTTDADSNNSKWLQHTHATFSPLPTSEDKHIPDTVYSTYHSLMSGGSEEKNVDEVYDKLASLGLKFGPTFRSIEKVWKENNSLLAKVKVPAEYQQYLVHPVILDAMVQAVMMLHHTDNLKKKLYVPIKIGKFVWLSPVKSTEIFIQVYDEHSVSTAVLLGESGQALAIMSQVELIDTTVKAVESVLSQQTTSMPGLWEESWRPKIGPMQYRLQLDRIPSMFYTPEFYQNAMDKHSTLSPDRLEAFVSLEQFVYYNLLKGLYECGWAPDSNEFTVQDLMAELKIQKEYEKFVRFILVVLQSEGVLSTHLEQKEEMWRVISKPPPYSEIQTRLASPLYTENLAKSFAPTLLLQKIGESLKNIFTENQSALSVLFPEETTNSHPSVAVFYEDYANYFQASDMVVPVIGLKHKHWLTESKGEKMVLRILEVGAGTGVFAKHCLSWLEELGHEYEYTYTDISAAFFAPAGKKFENSLKHMIFKKLNIEQDPLEQGFVPEYYDYIIASDVIHATKDIREALRNVNKLLKPNGSLDLMEQTKVNRILTFTFGLMEGFWRFEDFDLRPDHCTLDVDRWKGAFESTGFDVTGVFPSVNNYHALLCVNKRCLVSPPKLEREVGNISKEPPKPRVWMLYWNDDKLCRYLQRRFAAMNCNLIVVHKSEKFEDFGERFNICASSNEDFTTMMTSITAKYTVAGIVYAWALDDSCTEQSDVLQPCLHLSKTLALLKQKTLPRLVALTKGVSPVGDADLSTFHLSTIWGFTKTLQNENNDMTCRCVDVNWGEIEGGKREALEEVFCEIWKDDKEVQVAYNRGYRYLPKFQSHKPSTHDLTLPTGTDRFQLILPETKAINDLQFGPMDHLELEENEIEIQVKASALNFRDVFTVLKPTDQFNGVCSVGFDLAGVVKRTGTNVSKWTVGDTVFGVNVHGGPMPSHVKLRADDVLRVPDNMTLCEAATLPAVYITAYYCLVDIAKLTANDTILIHTASGGVGLGAVELVKHIGARIIATAGSKRKQDYLRSLGIQHVFHSRNTSYGDQILELTQGRGVDVVLNALTSEGFKEATLKACAPGARFIEMSKLSIWQPEEVKARRPDVDYTIVDVASLDPAEWQRLLRKLESLVMTDIFRPIPYVRFHGVNIREALSYLQKAKHIGKVVCVMPETILDGGQMVTYTPMFNDKSTYLITGGLGGIGFEVAKWMVKSGAKHVLLAGRSKPNSGISSTINQMNEGGAHVISVQLDIGNYDEVKTLIDQITSGEMGLPPLRGVMHAAGILADGLIANQEWSKLSSTFNTKIRGTLNLHKLTLNCRLEHFVVFSSVAALFGSPGQCNHAAGNNFQDTFTQYRHSLGLPATSVNWGQWGQVGVATEVDLPGLRPLSTLQGLTALEYVLKAQRVQTSALNMDSFVVFSKLFPLTANYLDERLWKSANSAAAGSSFIIKSDEFWQKYDSLLEKDGKLELVREYLRLILRRILKLDDSEVFADDTDFQEMGVDSLMFVEIKNALQSLFGDRVTVTANALRDCNTIRLLSQQLVNLIEDDTTSDESCIPTQEEIWTLIQKDCVLPDCISIENVSTRVANEKEIRRVLLTGATGNLGPYILRELSNYPQISQIYCLLRPHKTKSGEERLREILQSKQLLSMVNMSKVICVEGNVSEEHLGMGHDHWTKLAQELDAVFHCAILADHSQFYKMSASVSDTDIRAVNIEGLKNVLKFTTESRLKYIYNSSSLIAVMTAEADGTFSENWPQLEELNKVSDISYFAYPVTKSVGDYLMKQAHERGIPCKVFRLPLICGDSKTGRHTVELNHMVLRYLHILKTGAMPSNPWPMVVLPVDICATASLQLFFNENAPCDIYNITHHQPNLDQEFVVLADKFGYKIDLVEFTEFAQRMGKDKENSGVYDLVKEHYRDGDKLFDSYGKISAFQKWLEGAEDFWTSKKVSKLLPDFYTGLEPTIDYIERDLMFAKQAGWFEKLGL